MNQKREERKQTFWKEGVKLGQGVCALKTDGGGRGGGWNPFLNYDIGNQKKDQISKHNQQVFYLKASQRLN